MCKEFLRIPVLNYDLTPLMPTTKKRAEKFIKEKKAISYKTPLGIQCIKLLVEPSGIKTQKITLGLDPGKNYTGIGLQSSKNTLLGIHVKLPCEVKKNNLLRNNMNFELKIVQELCNLFPVSKIAYEISETKKIKKDWNSDIKNQQWMLKQLKDFAPTEGIDGVITSQIRKILGLFKQKSSKGECKPETQVVDGIALATSGYMLLKGKKRKIFCKITPASFVVLQLGRMQKKDNISFSANIKNIDYRKILVREKKNGKLVSKSS